MQRFQVAMAAATVQLAIAAGVAGLGVGPAAAADNPIVIGAAVAQSGFMAANDVPSLAGFKVYVDAVNAKGGLDGRKIVVKTVDTTSTTSGSKDAATRLLGEKIDILLTSANFDFGAPAGNVAQARNMLNFSLGAASPLYGPVGIGPQAFSSAPSTYLEGHVMAQVLADLGKKHPFVLTDDSIDYGTQVGQGVQERFEQLGIKPAGVATFKNGDSSIATQVSQIESSGADSITLATYLPGGAAALRQIRAAGIDLPVASDLGMGGSDWAKAVPNLSNFYMTALASIYGDDPDPAVQAFVASYKKAANSDPANTQVVEGYNVGQLIMAALRDTNGSTDGPALTAALEKMNNFAMLGGAITYNADQHIKQDGPVTVLKFAAGKPAFFKVIRESGQTKLGVAQ